MRRERAEVSAGCGARDGAWRDLPAPAGRANDGTTGVTSTFATGARLAGRRRFGGGVVAAAGARRGRGVGFALTVDDSGVVVGRLATGRATAG